MAFCGILPGDDGPRLLMLECIPIAIGEPITGDSRRSVSLSICEWSLVSVHLLSPTSCQTLTQTLGHMSSICGELTVWHKQSP